MLAVAHGISLDACQAINDVSVRKHIHSFNNRVACDLLINTVSAIDHDSSIADRFDSGVLPDADAFRCNSGNFKRLDPVGVAFAEQFCTFRSDNLHILASGKKIHGSIYSLCITANDGNILANLCADHLVHGQYRCAGC